jgi:hypothetical protein
MQHEDLLLWDTNSVQILSKFFRLIARIPLEDRVMITGLDI